MKKYFRLLRVHHYIKNGLVLAALFFSGQLVNTDKLMLGMYGFLSFCFLSSAVYVINDIRDKEKDQNHPIKSRRPIASGEIDVKYAYIACIVCLLTVIMLNFYIANIISGLILAFYFFLNLLYSLGLKKVPLLDIVILVLGFMFRVLYGAVITNITISNWMYLTVMAFSFYFALGKRKTEFESLKEMDTRPVLMHYSKGFLDKNMYMCITLANVFYALWSTDSKTLELYGNGMLLTVPLVILISMKYSMDVESGEDGDPIVLLFRDKILIALGAIYVCVMCVIVYIIN